MPARADGLRARQDTSALTWSTTAVSPQPRGCKAAASIAGRGRGARVKTLLVAVALLAVPLALVPFAEATPLMPPVCMQKTYSAAGTTVTAQLTCEVEVEVTHCTRVGPPRCWTTYVETEPVIQAVADALTCTCPLL